MGSLTRPLPPAAADRLVRIAGLLGSSHAGESANAAAAATRIIKEHDLTWEQVVRTGIAAPSPPQSQARPAPRHDPLDWRAAATACLARADMLSAWEQNFVASLLGFRQLSAKQAALLDRIFERIRAAGGAP